MVDIKKDIRFNPINTSLQNSTAIAQDVANVRTGELISNIGDSLISSAGDIQETQRAYQAEAQAADDAAVYANSISNATIDYQNRFQERINQIVDDDGNPTYGSLQRDVADIGREVLEDYLEPIQSAEVRARFQQNFNNYTANQQIASISIMRNQQLSFISESLSGSLQELGSQAGASQDEPSRIWFENQANQILNDGVASGALSPDQRGTLQNDFRREVSISVLRNSINADPVGTLDVIKNSEASELKLTESERLSMQNEAQTAANRFLTAQAGLKKEQDNFIRDQLREFENIIDEGGQIPQDAQDKISEIIEGSGFESEFSRVMHRAEAINIYTMEDPITRQAILNQLNSDQTLTLDGLNLRNKLDSINNNINQQIDNDVYSLGIQQGIVDNPVPFDPKGDIQEQLKSRLSSINMVENHYQVRTSGLTSEELNGWQEHYRDSTYQVKAQILGDVVAGLGNNAYNFLEDIAKTGSTNAAAIGSLMVEGDSATATTILQGQDIISKQPDIIPSTYRETEAAVKENVLPFYDLIEQQSDVLSMTRAYYAALTHEEHDFSLDANVKRLQESMAAVTNGGAISFNRTQVEPPVKGMSSNDLKRWVRGITLEDINASGGWDGFPDDRITTHLRNSTLITHGKGRYLVFLKDGFNVERPVRQKNGEVFVLDYKVIEGSGRLPILSKSSEEINDSVSDYLMTQVK